MTIIAKDSFNRNNTEQSLTGLGTTETGQVWQPHNSGNAFINNNTAMVNSSDCGQVLDIGTNKFTVEVQFFSVNGNPQLILGTDKSTTDRYTFIEYSSNSWNIYRRDGGSWTLLGSGGENSGQVGDIIKAVVDGTTITVYRNGTEITSGSDTDILPTSTTVGLGSGAGLVEFDNFIVESITSSGPSTPPIPTVVSVDREEISNITGMNQSHLTFTFDSDVTAWEIRVMGTGNGSGILADSGGAVTKGTEITAIIDNTELYQEGNNKVNIYGQNEIGWTPYETDPNAQKTYYLSTNGVSDTLILPLMAVNRFILDVEIGSGLPAYSNILDTREITSSAGYYSTSEIGGEYNTYKIDGVDASRTINDTTLPKDKRILIELTTETIGYKREYNGNAYIFGMNGYGTIKGKIYKVKCMLDNTIVANYDISNGSVEDVSGNGNHATLVGGTWVEI